MPSSANNIVVLVPVSTDGSVTGCPASEHAHSSGDFRVAIPNPMTHTHPAPSRKLSPGFAASAAFAAICARFVWSCASISLKAPACSACRIAIFASAAFAGSGHILSMPVLIRSATEPMPVTSRSPIRILPTQKIVRDPRGAAGLVEPVRLHFLGPQASEQVVVHSLPLLGSDSGPGRLPRSPPAAHVERQLGERVLAAVGIARGVLRQLPRVRHRRHDVGVEPLVAGRL